MSRESRFSSVCERDIDLLLLEEIHASEVFREWLVKHALDSPVAEFVGAWHSVTDVQNRESDLEVALRTAGEEDVLLLIENKIGASFQPEQLAGYRSRGVQYCSTGRCGAFRVVLVAPTAYIASHQESAGFDARITYEDLLRYFREQSEGLRAQHKAALMQAAIDKGHTGPSDEDVQSVLGLCRTVVAQATPTIRITSKAQTAKAKWIHLTFDGPAGRPQLRYRWVDRWVELAYSRKRVDESRLKRALSLDPIASACLAERGATELALWVPVPELDLTASRSSQAAVVMTSLTVAAALAEWHQRNESILVGAEARQ